MSKCAHETVLFLHVGISHLEFPAASYLVHVRVT